MTMHLLRALPPQVGLHCWAMVGGFLELEVEMGVLRKKSVSYVVVGLQPDWDYGVILV